MESEEVEKANWNKFLMLNVESSDQARGYRQAYNMFSRIWWSRSLDLIVKLDWIVCAVPEYHFGFSIGINLIISKPDYIQVLDLKFVHSEIGFRSGFKFESQSESNWTESDPFGFSEIWTETAWRLIVVECSIEEATEILKLLRASQHKGWVAIGNLGGASNVEKTENHFIHMEDKFL